MGMYDCLLVDPSILPLPKEDLDQVTADEVWQSKSLDCALDNYKIDKYGLLYKFDRLGKRFLTIDYHGEICFYTDIDQNTNEGWREFTAKFINGKLINIIRTDNI